MSRIDIQNIQNINNNPEERENVPLLENQQNHNHNRRRNRNINCCPIICGSMMIIIFSIALSMIAVYYLIPSLQNREYQNNLNCTQIDKLIEVQYDCSIQCDTRNCTADSIDVPSCDISKNYYNNLDKMKCDGIYCPDYGVNDTIDTITNCDNGYNLCDRASNYYTDHHICKLYCPFRYTVWKTFTYVIDDEIRTAYYIWYSGINYNDAIKSYNNNDYTCVYTNDAIKMYTVNFNPDSVHKSPIIFSSFLVASASVLIIFAFIVLIIGLCQYL